MKEIRNDAKRRQIKQFLYEYAFLEELERVFWNREREYFRKQTLYLYFVENRKEDRDKAFAQCNAWIQTMLLPCFSQRFFDQKVKITALYEQEKRRHRMAVETEKIKIEFYIIPPGRNEKPTVWHRIRKKSHPGKLRRE